MTLLEATNELTKPWNEIVAPDQPGDEYRVVDHKPRITMLREAIASNAGGSTGGTSLASTRNIIDLAAFDLWQRIDEQTRSALQEHGIKAKPELIDALDQMGERLDALRNTNSLREEIHTKLIARVQGWLGAIENLFDPPTRKEIKGACPACSTSRVTVNESETWAIFAYYWKGHAPAATCQACGKHWQGQKDLLELGFSINANMDHDELAVLGITDDIRGERATSA